MRSLVSSLLLLSLACSAEPPARERAAAAPATEESAEEASPTPRAAATAMEATPAPAAAEERRDLNDLQARLRAVGELMQTMREAAAEAAEGESTLCGQAHAAMVAAVEAQQEGIRSLSNTREPDRWLIAERARYIELCEQLPEDAQRCARFDYRLQNGRECGPIMEALSQAQKDAMEEMAHRERP